MSGWQELPMAYCDRCRGERPVSTNGKCLALHRGAPLGRLSTFKGESTLLNPRQLAMRQELADTTPMPRKRYDQAKVRDAVSSLLAGLSTLQQASRLVGCDTDYLHKKAWAAAKAAVHARDGGRCQFPGDWCYSDDPIDCHHRVTKGTGGSSNPLVAYYLPNLIDLCRRHHKYVTVNPLAGEELGLGIPRLPPVDPATIPAMTIHGLTLLWPDGERTIIQPDQEAS